MKRTRLAALTVAVVLFAPAGRSADFRMLSSWDKNNPAVPAIAESFIKNVGAASNGSMRIILNGPETVPPFEQLQPVVAGAFQFLYTHGAYHFGTTPMLTVLEAIGGDIASRRASGILGEIDKHYQKLGLKIIAFPTTPDGAYHFILRQPVSSPGDLAGRKIRSTPTYLGVFRMLGASMVGLPPAQIYTSLEKGVIEGTTWPVLGALGYRWYEVTKYLLRPAFGFSTQPILMNFDAWNRLTDAERKLLLEEGRKVEDAWYKEAGRLADEEEKALLAKGMQLTYMGSAQQAKLKGAWAEGLWQGALAGEKHRKDVEALRQFARQKGLAQ